MLKYVLIAIVAYLIGSISMSIIISKYVYHDDVRNHGSGNAGATNVARSFGWVPGILTFVSDFTKCVVAMLLGKWLGGDWGYCIAGIFCLLGHCYPIYFGFKGGKAVSTGACVALLIDWRIFLLAALAFIIIVLFTKIVSIASLAAAVAVILGSIFLSYSLPLKILGIFTGALVIFMHRDNITRLMKGEEKKFRASPRSDKKQQ